MEQKTRVFCEFMSKNSISVLVYFGIPYLISRDVVPLGILLTLGICGMMRCEQTRDILTSTFPQLEAGGQSTGVSLPALQKVDILIERRKIERRNKKRKIRREERKSRNERRNERRKKRE
jgi:hypothetical protein